MNNLQALESLKQSLIERKTEQERIMNEITQKSLNDLNKNLTATFNQKLDSTLESMQEAFIASVKSTKSKSKKTKSKRKFEYFKKTIIDDLENIALYLMDFKKRLEVLEDKCKELDNG